MLLCSYVMWTRKRMSLTSMYCKLNDFKIRRFNYSATCCNVRVTYNLIITCIVRVPQFKSFRNLLLPGDSVSNQLPEVCRQPAPQSSWWPWPWRVLCNQLTEVCKQPAPRSFWWPWPWRVLCNQLPEVCKQPAPRSSWWPWPWMVWPNVTPETKKMLTHKLLYNL